MFVCFLALSRVVLTRIASALVRRRRGGGGCPLQPISNADFIIPVEIEDHVHQVYVLKRPEVDQFMKEMGELYEVVVFTASLAKYADPVLDLLDKHKVVRWRMFRERCHN